MAADEIRPDHADIFWRRLRESLGEDLGPGHTAAEIDQITDELYVQARTQGREMRRAREQAEKGSH